MRVPAPSRAYWSKTMHCRICKRPRPFFLGSTTSNVCKMCYRARSAEQQRKSRLEESQERRTKRLATQKKWRDAQPRAAARARSAYARAWKTNPQCVRGSPEEFFPIYEAAEQMARNDPEHKYIIVYIIPIKARKEACGLHTPTNLKILKTKRAPQGASRRYYRTAPL